jgi:hypothetical protein
MNNFVNGKSFTVKPSDHNNEGNEVAELHFTAKKHLNKFHRNLAKGKGIRIQPHELHDIKIQNGSGFFDSIRNAFNRVGDVAKKVFNSPVTKGIVKTVAPIATKMAGDAIKSGVTAYTGNPALGEVAGTLGQKGLQAGSDAYTGSGVKRARGKRSHVVGGSFGALGGSIKKRGGAVVAVPAVSTVLRGPTNNVRLGGAIAAQSMVGITSTPGLEAINSNVDRMRKVRSFIGQNRLS